MSTQVSGVQAAAAASAKAESKNNGLNIDQKTFLTLLVAQLKYQDPLSPQSDTEFVAQLAQMTSLEEMQKLNTAFSSVQAYNLTGKTVYAEAIDEQTGKAEAFFGKVDSIVYLSGTYYAMVGENKIEVSDILQVFSPDVLSGDGTTLTAISNLIGRTISGSYTDGEGQPREITGTVTSVASEGGVIYAYIGETAVAIANITGISAGDAETTDE